MPSAKKPRLGALEGSEKALKNRLCLFEKLLKVTGCSL